MPQPDILRFRLNHSDLVEIKGIPYVLYETNSVGHVLTRFEKPDIAEHFTHEELHELARQKQLVYRREHFSQGSAKARLVSDTAILTTLPMHEQRLIMWRLEFCRRFLQLEHNDPSVTRSDRAMKPAIKRIDAEIASMDIAQAQCIRSKQPGGKTKNGRKPRSGVAYERRIPPGPKALRDWLKLFKAASYDALGLRPGYYRCGNRNQGPEPEVYKLTQKHAAAFSDERRPSAMACYRNLCAELNDLNTERVQQCLPPYNKPSYGYFLARIEELNKFQVDCARDGIQAAQRKYGIVTSGPRPLLPLERVEMDEWEAQLKTLMIEAGVWDLLTPKEQASVERVRMSLCASIDVATKYMLGMSLARTASVENALTTLGMIVRDKSTYARSAGALSSWSGHGTPMQITVDNGPALIALEFRIAVVSLRIQWDAAPAGKPRLRGTIERLFRTLHMQLAAMFTGRTFENTVRLGDYPADERASLTVDELAQVLVRYFVDIYHNTPHESLGGETPANAWRRLVGDYGVPPAPDANLRRMVLGLQLTRVVAARGVRCAGIYYQCEELQAYRRQVGEVELECRLDPEDLGAIAVKVGEKYITVPAIRKNFRNFDGLSLATWTSILADLRRRYAAEAAITLPIVMKALQDIRAISDRAIERAGIGPTTVSDKTVAHLEETIAMGVDLWDQEEAEDPTETISEQDPFRRAIEPRVHETPAPAPPATAHQAPSPQPRTKREPSGPSPSAQMRPDQTPAEPTNFDDIFED